MQQSNQISFLVCTNGLGSNTLKRRHAEFPIDLNAMNWKTAIFALKVTPVAYFFGKDAAMLQGLVFSINNIIILRNLAKFNLTWFAVSIRSYLHYGWNYQILSKMF